MTTDKPKTTSPLPHHTLEGLLAWGEKERDAVLDMLKLVPSEMQEYNILQDRLEKLETKLVQIRKQLAA